MSKNMQLIYLFTKNLTCFGICTCYTVQPKDKAGLTLDTAAAADADAVLRFIAGRWWQA